MLKKYKQILEGFKNDVASEIVYRYNNYIKKNPNSELAKVRNARLEKEGLLAKGKDLALSAAISADTSARHDRFKRDLKVGGGIALAGLAVKGIYDSLKSKEPKTQKEWEKYGCAGIKDVREKERCVKYLASRN